MTHVKRHDQEVIPPDQTDAPAFEILWIDKGRFEQMEKPHRHLHYSLIFCQEGGMTEEIDFTEYRIEAPAIVTISPAQVHLHRQTNSARFFVITFAHDFLFSSGADYHWEHLFTDNVIPVSAAQMDGLLPYFELLLAESERFESNKAVISKLLFSLLEKIETFAHDHDVLSSRSKYEGVYRSFKDLVEKHFMEDTRVRDYAARLYMTAGHLNDVIRKVSGQNAKSIIAARRVLEAKRLLYWTELSIREVAWKMGFEDPAYFTRFFKKHTGSLPGDFRRKIQRK